MTNSTDTATETRLLAYLNTQPQDSLAWAIMYEGLHNWDDTVLSWMRTILAADDLWDLYGLGTASVFDAQEFVLNVNSYYADAMALWRSNYMHKDAPDVSSDHFFEHVYLFALKLTCEKIMCHLDIPK